MKNIVEKMKSFDKRWDVTNLPTDEEEFKKFKNRIQNTLFGIDDKITSNGIKIFYNTYGIPNVYRQSFPGEKPQLTSNIFDILCSYKTKLEIFRFIELLFELEYQNFSYHRDTQNFKEVLYSELYQVFDISNVNAQLICKNTSVLIISKGETLLDEEVVNPVISCLQDNCLDHFTNALKFYQAKDYIECAESLRRTLEEYLRVTLHNTKGLKENIRALSKNLKDKHCNSRLIIQNTISEMDTYFNENSKHNDGNIDEIEAEYLIYQTALLVRYLHRKSDTTTVK